MCTAVSVALSIPSSVQREMANSSLIYNFQRIQEQVGGSKGLTNRKSELKHTCKAWRSKKNQEKLNLMQDFQQSDKWGMAKSQLITLFWVSWLWNASRKSDSNTQVSLQIILTDWKFKVWPLSQQCSAMADLIVSWFRIWVYVHLTEP